MKFQAVADLQQRISLDMLKLALKRIREQKQVLNLKNRVLASNMVHLSRIKKKLMVGH